MPFYETVFIARQDLSTAQVEELTQALTDIVKKGGGKVHKTESWGLRNLTYRIKKNRKGHYVLIETDSNPDAVLEMERNMRFNEDILRYLTIKNDKLSEGPSPILDKGGRDDESPRFEKFEKDAA